MEIKYTIEGLLIYLAMGNYLLAFIVSIVNQRRAGSVLYFLGFVAAGLAFVWRWCNVGHVPLQNLFEVFLFLGVFIWPVSQCCRRFLRVGGDWTDMLIGGMVLLPAGFIFSDTPQQLPPALQSGLFVPHVAVYMLSYIFMARAAIQAGLQVCGKDGCHESGMLNAEEGSYTMVCVGFPLHSAGLFLGSWWGKLAWGDYWGWDPKEMWSLASWMVYVGYFHFRYMFGKRHARINSMWVIAGMALIVITLLWANLSRIFTGLHSYAI